MPLDKPLAPFFLEVITVRLLEKAFGAGGPFSNSSRKAAKCSR